MNPYLSALFLTTLILNSTGDALIPSTPFRQYGINCVKDGKDVTYRLDSLKEGDEILCKLDYRAEPYPGNPGVLVEKGKAEKFAGYMGSEWDKIKIDEDYIRHYPITKEDSLAVYTELGVKVPYDGVDKDEAVKFCQWTEVKEVIEAIDIKVIK